MAANGAAKNRKIRQEAMREQLSAKGLVQHVLEIAKDLNERGATMSSQEIQAKKSAAELQLRLVSKYLPDLKAVELTGEAGDSIKADLTWNVEVKKPG